TGGLSSPALGVRHDDSHTRTRYSPQSRSRALPETVLTALPDHRNTAIRVCCFATPLLVRAADSNRTPAGAMATRPARPFRTRCPSRLQRETRRSALRRTAQMADLPDWPPARAVGHTLQSCLVLANPRRCTRVLLCCTAPGVRSPAPLAP